MCQDFFTKKPNSVKKDGKERPGVDILALFCYNNCIR